MDDGGRRTEPHRGVGEAGAARPWGRDPFFYAALALGLPGLAFEPASAPSVWLLAVMAAAEEAVFRLGLQDWLEGRLGARLGPVTAANAAASAVFALAHLPWHPPLWALAAFFPSLVLGALWTRHRRLAPCAIAHFAYNLLYFM